jgi:putative transcriptional regulator
MYTFAETPTFVADADKLWSEAERLEFFTWLSSNPESTSLVCCLAKSGCFSSMPNRCETTFPVNCLKQSERKSKMANKIPTKRISSGEALGLKLLQSVREMKAGRAARSTQVEPNEVVQARQNTGLSQAQFAEALSISKRTLQEWEQGRRSPSGAAQTLIRIAKNHPEVVREALS